MSTTREFTVSGMTCAHCERAVSAEVSKIANVTGAQVDAGTGTLRITADAPLDDAAVVAAVVEAGYTVTDQRVTDQ